MRKEFVITLILIVLTCVLTAVSPFLYIGPHGIDGIGAAILYVLFIRFLQIVLIVGAITSAIIGVARKNRWSKKHVIIAAISPTIIILIIIILLAIVDRIWGI